MSTPQKSVPRIARGPMAAEVLERDYTRISNELLRDPRLSYKAKGIFCWLASHRDGFGVSLESIAAAGADGISAAKSALRELEEFGYLVRSQVRLGSGLMGQTTYWISDMPRSEPVDGNRSAVPTCDDAQNPRSEPVDGKPPAVEPPAVDRPHKKTIPFGKKISSEKTTSSVAEDVTEGPAETGPSEGGGGGSDLRSTAQQITSALDYRGKTPDKRQQQRITDGLVAALQAGWTLEQLAVYLDLGDAAVQSPAAVYAHRLKPDVLPAPQPLPVPQPRRGGSRAEPLPASAYAGVTTASLLFGEQPASNAWAEARQRVGAMAGGGGHRPYSNDVWCRPADPAAAALIPHCGDLDCDPSTRIKDYENEKGFKFAQNCGTCHPDMLGL